MRRVFVDGDGVEDRAVGSAVFVAKATVGHIVGNCCACTARVCAKVDPVCDVFDDRATFGQLEHGEAAWVAIARAECQCDMSGVASVRCAPSTGDGEAHAVAQNPALVLCGGEAMWLQGVPAVASDTAPPSG